MNDTAETHSWSNRDVVMALAIGGAALTAGVILAPYVLPAIGFEPPDLGIQAINVLHNHVDGAGIAGGLNHMLASIPVIGEQLANGGLFNAAAAGIIGVGGVLFGHLMHKQHCDSNQKGIDWGKIIKWGALATSALIALPSVLSAIGTGIMYLAMQFGSYDTAMGTIGWVRDGIGTIPFSEAGKVPGLSGVSATLPHLLTCGLSFVPAATGFGVDEYLTRQEEYEATHANVPKKILHPDDKNNFITPEEQKLVDSYNNATPAKKIILQKQLRSLGYDPDFHKDGTVHLHKHAHKPAEPSRSI